MGLLDGFKNENGRRQFEVFKNKTEDLMLPASELLKRNPGGGFIKVHAAKKNSSFTVCLNQSHLHQNLKYYGGSMKKCIMETLKWKDEKSVKQFLEKTEFSVNEISRYETQVMFSHYFHIRLSSKSCIRWLQQYLESNYPACRTEVKADGVIFVFF